MKNKHLCKHISLLLAILMLLPLFAFGVTAEEAEISAAQSAVKAEADALAAKKADLVQGLEAASTIFDYVDKASFVEAGHVERLADEEELNSYVFRNPDGSKTVYFLAEDVKYVSVTGAVTEKRLELVALDGGFTTRSSNVSLALPNDLHRGITLAHGGATVSLAPDRSGLAESASVATSSLFAAVEELEQELVSAPTGIAAGRADYQNAFGVGTTLRYTPTLSGVKEDVILDRYRGKNSFSFTLNTGNLSVFNENGRYFIAESVEDEEKIFIGETWVYDSQDHFEKGTLSVTQKSEGVYTLTIGASVDFLTSPDTVYPVYIDPSLTVSYGEDGEGYIEDVTVYSGTPDTNYGGANFCFVGKHPSYGTARTAIRLTCIIDRFSYEILHNAFIDSATLTLRAQSGISTATTARLHPLKDTDWTETGATWKSLIEDGGGYAEDYLSEGALLVNANMTFDLTDFVKDWKIDNAHYPTTIEQGFLMVSSNENIQKRFCSSEVTISSYKPVFTLTYHEGLEILSPYQTYRAVEENELVYVKQGEFFQFEAVTTPMEGIITWTSSNTSIATISPETGELNPVLCGQITVTITRTMEGTNNILASDTIDVCIVPLAPGEYFMENLGKDSHYTEWNGGEVIAQIGTSKNSRWVFQYYSAGYYTIKSSETGKYLSAPSQTDAPVTLTDFVNNDSIRWIISSVNSGARKIVSKANGLCLKAQMNDYPLVMGSYTSDSSREDEWDLCTTTFTLVNYYDSTFLSYPNWIENITQASIFAQKIYQKEFGITFEIKSEPIYRSDMIYESSECSGQTCTDACGECYDFNLTNFDESDNYHHKNVQRISDQLYYAPREDGHIYTIWGNNPDTFCSEVGNHHLVEALGYTRQGRPVLQVIEITGDTDTEVSIIMALTLAHELAHVFNMSDVYPTHNNNNSEASWCIMSSYDVVQSNSEAIYNYYMYDIPIQVSGDEAQPGAAPAFCRSCLSTLSGEDGIVSRVFDKDH